MAAADELLGLLDTALERGDESALRGHLVDHSGLHGPRMNLRLVTRFVVTVGTIVQRVDAPGDALADVLDRWAALPVSEAPGDRPEVILPCAAVAAYGEVGAVRPEWRDDEVAKVRRAASDARWRVREMVAVAVQRLLAADWDRMVATLREWATDRDPLVVRAAAAGVAEPPLLRDPAHAAAALEVQRRAVEGLRRVAAGERRSEPVRVLRQALGFTVSVAVAASGDFELLESMAASGDPDLRWVVRENLKKRRLTPWPEAVERVRALLAP